MIGATNRPEMLDRALRRPGRFEKEMEVGVPTPAARTAMLEQNMHPLSHNVTKEGMKRIAGTLHGFVAADIYGLAQAGAMRVMSRCGHSVSATASLCIDAMQWQGRITIVCCCDCPSIQFLYKLSMLCRPHGNSATGLQRPQDELEQLETCIFTLNDMNRTSLGVYSTTLTCYECSATMSDF